MSDFVINALSRESLEEQSLSGQGSIEWILIVALIAVAIIGGLTALSGAMKDKLTTITKSLQSVTTNTP